MAEEVMDCALRALRHRDRTEREVEEHLRVHGFSNDDGARALATLRRTGLVDDARFAHARASSLASRSAGNALVRARLCEAGIATELADDAIDALETEAIRASRVVTRRGASPKTARYLYGKGFSEDAVSAAIAERGDGELG